MQTACWRWKVEVGEDRVPRSIVAEFAASADPSDGAQEHRDCSELKALNYAC